MSELAKLFGAESIVETDHVSVITLISSSFALVETA